MSFPAVPSLSCSLYCVETTVWEAAHYFSALGALPLGGSGHSNRLAVSMKMLCLRSSFRLSI